MRRLDEITLSLLSRAPCARAVLTALALSVCLSAGGLQARADVGGWCHEIAKSTDNTQVQWDFVPVEIYPRFDSPSIYRTSNYIHVANERFTGKEKVVIVVIDYVYPPSPQVLQLKPKFDPDTGRFTAQLEDRSYILIQSPRYPATYQEIAVAVDDVWLKDPISGRSNFVFAATKYDNYKLPPLIAPAYLDLTKKIVLCAIQRKIVLKLDIRRSCYCLPGVIHGVRRNGRGQFLSVMQCPVRTPRMHAPN